MGRGQEGGIGGDGDPTTQRARARARLLCYTLTLAYKVRRKGTADQQGIEFIPDVAESFVGWHKVGLVQLRKLGSALARHTGQGEGETIGHLLTTASELLQKGLPVLLLNKIPSYPAPIIGGSQ